MKHAYASNVIGVLLTLYGLSFAKRASMGSHVRNHQYIKTLKLAAVSTIIDTLCYIAQDYEFPKTAMFLNSLIFCLAPMVVFEIYKTFVTGRKIPWYIHIAKYINTVLIIVNLYTECLFYVGAKGTFIRQNYFIIVFVPTGLFIVLGVIYMMRCYSDANCSERRFLYMVFGLPVLMTLVHIFWVPDELLVWPACDMAIFMYGVFSIDYSAKFDLMTMCRNHSQFEEELERLKDVENYAVVVFDLNGLKEINDTKGHIAGDYAICAAAEAGREAYPGGLIFRTGGDEFCIILKNEYAKERKVYQCADRFRKKCIQDRRLGNAPSVGMAFHFWKSEETALDIYKSADRNMYFEKKKIYHNQKET